MNVLKKKFCKKPVNFFLLQSAIYLINFKYVYSEISNPLEATKQETVYLQKSKKGLLQQ